MSESEEHPEGPDQDRNAASALVRVKPVKVELHMRLRTGKKSDVLALWSVCLYYVGYGSVANVRTYLHLIDHHTRAGREREKKKLEAQGFHGDHKTSGSLSRIHADLILSILCFCLAASPCAAVIETHRLAFAAFLHSLPSWISSTCSAGQGLPLTRAF